MKKLKLALTTVAVMALVVAVLPNLAVAADAFKDVFVTNTAASPVPTRAVGTTPVEGSVSIGNTPDVKVANTPDVMVANTPSVTVANNPGVSLLGSDNLTRSADHTQVVFEDTWEHDGSFLAYERGAFVSDYKTVRYLIVRQGPCSTDIEYVVSANMSFGAARSYVIDQGVVPASGTVTGLVELPGNILRVVIRGGTAESPCTGGVIAVGRRN